MLTASADISKQPHAWDIRDWLTKVEALMTILMRYGDEQSQHQLHEKRAILNDILDTIGLDSKGRGKTSGCLLLVIDPTPDPSVGSQKRSARRSNFSR